MISTLLWTIVIESIVVIGYSVGQKKPVFPILFTSISVNLVTQSLLWIVLTLFHQYYLVTLLLAEVVIWLVEGIALWYIPANRLGFKDAMFLGLSMNLLSFAMGWFLPV